VEAPKLAAFERNRDLSADGREPPVLAQQMIQDGLLTQFQASQLLAGKHRGFTLGKYRILEQLGVGGMGTVYLATHIHLGRRVAVKILAPQGRNPAAVERFFREARAAAALDHPNIVRAYDVDEEGKFRFLVMEYVDGTSLQRVVESGGPLTM